MIPRDALTFNSSHQVLQVVSTGTTVPLYGCEELTGKPCGAVSRCPCWSLTRTKSCLAGWPRPLIFEVCNAEKGTRNYCRRRAVSAGYQVSVCYWGYFLLHSRKYGHYRDNWFACPQATALQPQPSAHYTHNIRSTYRLYIRIKTKLLFLVRSLRMASDASATPNHCLAGNAGAPSFQTSIGYHKECSPFQTASCDLPHPHPRHLGP